MPWSSGERAARISNLAILTIIAILFYISVVVVFPFFRQDYNPNDQGISEYAVGPYGYFQATAFVVLGLGSMTLAVEHYGVLDGSTWTRIGVCCLVLGGVCLVLSGFFPVDVQPPATLSGIVHIVVVRWLTCSL